jgi:hypothetical protein
MMWRRDKSEPKTIKTEFVVRDEGDLCLVHC